MTANGNRGEPIKRPVFMIEIIQEGGMVETPAIELCFWYVGHRGNWGFCFPCNDKGKVNAGSLNPTARDRYEKCAAGTMRPEIERPVILHHTAINRESRIGRCHCGAKVHLDHFTNTCSKCGQDYNSSGTELGPREFWGEETGEHPTECI
jgi:hypothetical protein